MMKKHVCEKMVWTWAGWEPAQYYRRLGGFHEEQEGNALWMPNWFDTVHSERAAKALSEAGINWVTTHFYKGFGLEAEAGEMEAVRGMIRNYHQHGVNVFTYIQYGTIMPEELSEDWGRVDWEGNHADHPYEYGDQYWRRKPCANKPGFREYLLQVVTKAIEFGADGIWIDNLQSDGCHCPYCQEAFKNYLRDHVTDPWQELGIRDVSRVRIPTSERPRDPLFQRWLRFRCDETAESLRLIATTARALKPDVVLSVNIGIGNYQRHVIENANWFSALAHFDYTYAENHLFPRWENGRIIGQHFSSKVAQAVGIRIVPGGQLPMRQVGIYTHPSVPTREELRRTYAESALFGGHAAGGPFGLRGEDGGGDPLWLTQNELRNTNRKLVDCYAGFDCGSEAAEVALLYSYEAMGSDEKLSKNAFQAMEQMLLQNQIPFRILLSDHLENLSGLKLIILPHILPVSDNMATTLKAYVATGGKLLATGRTSLYDEWMRQRTDYALGDVFGVTYSVAFEEKNQNSIVVNAETGCVFIPGEWALDEGLTLSESMLLETIHAIVSSPVVCSAPHVGCSIRKLEGGDLLIGLINYVDNPVEGIRLAEPFANQAATVWSVDQAETSVANGCLPPVDVELFVRLACRK